MAYFFVLTRPELQPQNAAIIVKIETRVTHVMYMSQSMVRWGYNVQRLMEYRIRCMYRLFDSFNQTRTLFRWRPRRQPSDRPAGSCQSGSLAVTHRKQTRKVFEGITLLQRHILTADLTTQNPQPVTTKLSVKGKHQLTL